MVNGILKFVKTISANVKLNINQQEIKELVAVSLPSKYQVVAMFTV